MTKLDLIQAVASKTNLEQQEVQKVVQGFLDHLTQVIINGTRIEIRNFGVFEVKVRNARKARNPKTNEVVFVPSKKVVVFKPGKKLIP